MTINTLSNQGLYTTLIDDQQFDTHGAALLPDQMTGLFLFLDDEPKIPLTSVTTSSTLTPSPGNFEGITKFEPDDPDQSPSSVQSAASIGPLSIIGGQTFTQNDLTGSFSEIDDFFGTALVTGNFNGDSYADLIVGSEFEDLGTVGDAGGINAIYGFFVGLTSTGNQFWTQDDLDNSPSEFDDRFGSSLAVGDFDGDGYDDLAAGSVNEDYNAVIDAGSVNILYGSVAGLTITGNQFWVQDALDGSLSEEDDHLGSSLAVGDFDGDGYDDLAAGAVGEDFNAITNAGAVNVLYGSLAGLTRTGNQFWVQDSLNGSSSEAGDQLGSSLAVGDFDGDGYDDLAAGAVGEDFNAITDAGAVNVLYGSLAGLTSGESQFWVQDSLDGTTSEADDHFGSSLAVGDFDGDGYDDLATGAYAEDFNAVTDAGAVNVIYGSFSGLTSAGNQFWVQDSLTNSTSEAEDYFGASLAVGDFNGDGYDDLAVGAPGDDLSTGTDAGAVNVIYGSVFGLTATNSQFLTQASITGNSADPFDLFGYSLSSGDYDRDGYDDLAIAAPGEGLNNTGAINIVYGSSTGLV